MKRKFVKLLICLTAIFTTMPVLAQSDTEVLGHIENTNLYKTIELAHMDRELSTFMNLLALSGLEKSLALNDEHTLIIPTNNAFAKMTIEEFAELTNPTNTSKLIAFMKNHFIPSKVNKYAFNETQIISKMANDKIAISTDEEDVYIGGAKIVKADIEASNGLIHVVDNIVYAIN